MVTSRKSLTALACPFFLAVMCLNTVCAIDLTGEVVIVLLNVTNAMAPHVIPRYEMILEDFFNDTFVQTSGWPGEVRSWNVRLNKQERLFTQEEEGRRRQLGVTDHSRRLGAPLVPLETRCMVEAQATQTLGLPRYQDLLQSVLHENKAVFINDYLKRSDAPVVRVQFIHVNDTQIFGPGEVVTTPRVQPNAFDRAGVLAPLKSKPPSFGNIDGLSKGEIAGVVITCFVVILLCCYLAYLYWKRRHHNDDDDDSKEEDYFDIRASMTGSDIRESYRSGGGCADRLLRSSSASVMSRYRSQRLGALRSSSTRVISSEGKTLSIRQGNSFRMSHPGILKLTGESSKYASSIDTDDDDDDEVFSSPRPRFEDEPSRSKGSYEDRQGKQQLLQQEPQEQQQQQQPPPFRDPFDGISLTDSSRSCADVASFGQVSLDPSTLSDTSTGYYTYEGAPTRQVLAPPGRLGIIVETHLAGPIINKIHDDSPLRGMVHEGDLIVGIDMVDCAGMSASAITTLMVNTAKHPRRMIVKSPTNIGHGSEPLL